MLYKSINPDPALKDLVKQYWIIEDDDTKSEKRKIIPDGYPEIIFHYGDPYRIKLQNKWELQSKQLFAGQISKHFYLENTGASAMLGIKLMPAAAHALLRQDVSAYTDRVVPLHQVFQNAFNNLEKRLKTALSPEQKAGLAEKEIERLADQMELKKVGAIPKAVGIIVEGNGLTKMGDVADRIDVSRRHFERTFKQVVGLTPKYYSRIIRFNYIFEIMKKGSDSWIGVALDSGYFDQSHFIKEFKAFSGEEPSNYGFDEQTIANFFLKKE